MTMRAAKHHVRLEEEALASIHKQAINARDDLHQTPQDGGTQSWLMACAEAELCRAAATYHESRRQRAHRTAEEAAAFEASARIASKQMEHALSNSRQVEAGASARVEQMRLDEIARNLRRFSRSGEAPGSPV